MGIISDIFRHHMGRTRYAYGNSGRRSIATFNRWTGRAHEHKREIARNLKRQGASA